MKMRTCALILGSVLCTGFVSFGSPDMQSLAGNWKFRLDENKSGVAALQFEQTLRAAVAKLHATWPGLDVKPTGAAWEIIIPDKYRVGHEQHFAQVTEKFLRFLAEGNMPGWEVPNMIAKYYTTTEAYRLSHRRH